MNPSGLSSSGLPINARARRDGTPGRPPLLQVRGLRKSFGGIQALDGVSFTLPAGHMLALIGPNGAGKSTCFNALSGQMRPDAGSVLLGGRELVGLRPQQIWRQGVGRTFQTAATFRSMSARENVQTALLARDRRLFDGWRRADRHGADEALALLEQVGMASQAQRPCGELAYGDVKRVELAMALAHAPRLLLMDEPTAGMAAAERHALMRLTRSLADTRGIAVLFTEHSLDVVFQHADRIVVLVRGQVLADDAPAAIAADARVKAAYLGSEPVDAGA
ncbi:ABC transporter ATP-binding protein [Bordetella petrii]|uniref:ATP-binding component of branched-chain amino acid ABC transporter n=1 Tax=Bordetella petrii (strain ATCC BAA-461 / DSM 12804 / CCUG 43448 / CIP 107267 / Se-1111R) TaxID=340100 RepID=A9HWV2_BORPD|nr:ABC transporter ATP-binding protein [Bordetella petrii]CAP43659.1 putative ATP-binding component of branched-chain amino acid ABC transporter [Bordetella petrii]